MAEEIAFPIKEAETQIRYPNLRFEPGNHGPNAWERTVRIRNEKLDSRYQRGDPYAHPWDNAVIGRIETTKPKILAIDGLGFNGQWGSGDDPTPTMTPPFAEQTWLELPTTPARINDEGSVLVVGGDPLDIGDSFYTIEKYPDLQALRKVLDDKIKHDQSTIPQVTTAYLWIAGVIDAAILASIAEKRIRKKDKTIISRRNFLKGAGMATAGIAAWLYFESGLHYPQYITNAEEATTEAAKDKWLGVVDEIDPELITATYEQMRTAILALKLKDSVDHLDLPRTVSGSLIMGDGHSFGADSFLGDDISAQNAIGGYLGVIEPLISKALKENPTLKREFVVGKIKAYLAKTYIQKVDQPDPRTFFTRDFPDAVTAAISTVADFQSKRVEAAVADFD